MKKNPKIDIKALSAELESLINISGDSCGPLLIKELQNRIDKTIDEFNEDVKETLDISFKKYHDKINRCKKILVEKKIVDNGEFNDEGNTSPKFIQLYEKKNKKKL